MRRIRSSVFGAVGGAALALLCLSAPIVAAAPAAPGPSPSSMANPLGKLTSAASTSRSPAPNPTPTGSAITGPQLSIAIDNGRKSATLGDSLAYSLTVTNLGSTVVDGLTVTQSVPTGAAFVKADADGREKGGKVTWTVDLQVAKAATFHVTLKVLATPKDLLRLATVGCATLSAGSSPIVCASHSDQLPAGAIAASAAASAAQTAKPGGSAQGQSAADANTPLTATSRSPWWYIGGLAVVLVIVVSVAWWFHRLRKPPVPAAR